MTMVEGLFEPIPHGVKVRCTACGATGYDDAPWQDKHRRGHGPCPKCGSTVPLDRRGNPQVHSRCPRKGTTDGEG